MSRVSMKSVAAASMGVLFMGSLTADASSIVRMDVEALSLKAERVLLGRVEKIEAHELAPGSRSIVTDVTMTTEKGVLGVADGSRFVVRHLGGEVGRRGQRVHGEANFELGERVLLFAVERRGSYYTLGMAQGALHVYADGAGVARVHTRIQAAEVKGEGVSVEGHRLDEVLEQVRSFVARRAPASNREPQRH